MLQLYRSGEQAVEFTFNPSSCAGDTLVVLEELYKGSSVVAVHDDKSDEDQTVKVPTAEELKGIGANGKSGLVATGDNIAKLVTIGLILVILGILLFLIYGKRKKKDEEDDPNKQELGLKVNSTACSPELVAGVNDTSAVVTTVSFVTLYRVPFNR